MSLTSNHIVWLSNSLRTPETPTFTACLITCLLQDASAVNVTVRRWNIIAGSDEFGLGLGGTTTPFSFRAVVRAKARGGKRRHPPVYLYAFAHDLYGDADDSLGQTEMTWETPKLAFAGLVSSLAMFLYAVSGGSCCSHCMLVPVHALTCLLLT